MGLTAAVCALALVAGACAGDDRGPGISGGAGEDGASGGSDPSGSSGSGGGRANGDGSDVDGDLVIDSGTGEVILTSGLARFNDCDGLLGYLRDEYSRRVGAWGFDQIGGPVAFVDTLAVEMDDMAEAADASAESEPADAGSDGAARRDLTEGVDYSGTNVQEQGVDEADIVKTDGRRIFTVSGGRLVVVDAAERRQLGTVELEAGYSAEMFLSGDSVLVIRHGLGHETSTVVLQRVDVSPDGTPRVVGTLRVQGQYLSARSVSGTARIVIRHDPQWAFPFVYPANDSEEAVQKAESANKQAVRDSTLDDWLPNYATDGADPAGGPVLGECSRVHAPAAFSGFGFTAVMNVAVNGSFDPSAATVVTAPGDTVYASPQSLYVATTAWPAFGILEGDADRRGDSEEFLTSVHRFDISDAAGARYEASGDVDGAIRNQFSLSEHDGHLRIVTTTGGMWGDDTESQVRVLRQDGSNLIQVGSVGDIGRGEQVQSVRFVGNVGYVVTFRQIDPFYTIDLSDPTSPSIVGELKIPGFSSYLHPISDTMVLGVGSDADPEGRVTGAKVSLFDVSDLSAPREAAVWTAPDGWHDIGWDHRAFLWWAPARIAVIPVTVYPSASDQTRPWSGAVLLRVADGAITELGRVDHALDGEALGETACRVLSEEDLPTAPAVDDDAEFFNRDLEWMIRDSAAAVIACEVGVDPLVDGFGCHDEGLWVEDRRRGLAVETTEDVYVCWPEYELDAIVRSIVISDELWTLSNKTTAQVYVDDPSVRLQVHDLATLRRLAALEL